VRSGFSRSPKSTARARRLMSLRSLRPDHRGPINGAQSSRQSRPACPTRRHSPIRATPPRRHPLRSGFWRAGWRHDRWSGSRHRSSASGFAFSRCEFHRRPRKTPSNIPALADNRRTHTTSFVRFCPMKLNEQFVAGFRARTIWHLASSARKIFPWKLRRRFLR